jgi:hypothetical protein
MTENTCTSTTAVVWHIKTESNPQDCGAGSKANPPFGQQSNPANNLTRGTIIDATSSGQVVLEGTNVRAKQCLEFVTTECCFGGDGPHNLEIASPNSLDLCGFAARFVTGNNH